MSRTFSTSRIHREVIQAKGQRGSNQKSALLSGHIYPNLRRLVRSFPLTTGNKPGAPVSVGSPPGFGDMMPDMPGTNLTRDEAQTRARLLDVDSYTVELDLTTSESTFATTTTIAFTSTEPGAETFADLVGATIHEITLNGAALDPAKVYADNRITLSGLQETTSSSSAPTAPTRAPARGCTASSTRSTTGSTPTPSSRCPDARRVYATFEQPDLKSVFTFHVTAPEGWTVVSNAPTPEPAADRRGQGGLGVPADRADADLHHRGDRR